jgi:hypothetical protein
VTLTIRLPDKSLFPPEVQDLLASLHDAGFFEKSMLVGSWVMPVYRDAFGMPYLLRTLDIDFAVRLPASGSRRKADLDAMTTGLGYVPVTMQSGIRKYTRQNFAVEFISQRVGRREEEVVELREWNITAVSGISWCEPRFRKRTSFRSC